MMTDYFNYKVMNTYQFNNGVFIAYCHLEYCSQRNFDGFHYDYIAHYAALEVDTHLCCNLLWG